MSRRFSSRQLTFLRNQVPISQVIETLPTLVCRHAGGKLRFRCPLCREFNTSINTDHNLGRCFDCKKNFNPIELVMHQMQISFVQSVKWLIQQTVENSSTNPTTAASSSTHPTHIGNILADSPIMRKEPKIDPLPAKSIQQRITNLERKVEQLYHRVNELELRRDRK